MSKREMSDTEKIIKGLGRRMEKKKGLSKDERADEVRRAEELVFEMRENNKSDLTDQYKRSTCINCGGELSEEAGEVYICAKCEFQESEITEEYAKTGKDKLLKIKERYLRVFERVSHDNQIAGNLSFYMMLGSKFRNVKITKRSFGALDPRISVLWIQNSRSGKTEAWEIIGNMLKMMDLTYINISEFTDAALMGSFNSEGKLKNEPILGKFDVMHWDEAAGLLNPGRFQKKTQEFVRNALDSVHATDAKLMKVTGGGTTEVKPIETLWLTTTDPHHIPQEAVTGGFLLRLIVWPRFLTPESRSETNKRVIKGLIDSKGPETPFTELQEIARIISDIVPPETIGINRDGARILCKLSDEWVTVGTTELNTETSALIQEAVLPYIEMTIRMGAINAIIRGDTLITKWDLEQVLPLIKTIFTSFTNWGSNISAKTKTMRMVEEEKMEVLHIIYTYYMLSKGKDVIVPRKKFIDTLSKSKSISRRNATDRITKSSNFKTVKGKGWIIRPDVSDQPGISKARDQAIIDSSPPRAIETIEETKSITSGRNKEWEE